MATKPSLRIYSSVLSTGGSTFLADISQRTAGWTRSITSTGGFWQGTFAYLGDRQELVDFFYNRLGCHFEERSGGVATWEGLIYEMELTTGMTTRRRTLDSMWNKVRAEFQTTKGRQRSTAVVSNAQSIARYGQREEIITAVGELSAVEKRRDAFLLEHAWPWPRGVGITRMASADETPQDALEVTVCGYAFTGNWRFMTGGDGSTSNANLFVSNILAADCPFLLPGAIDTNTVQVVQERQDMQRAWDVLADITALGDTNADPWHIWVDAGRRLHYRKIDTTPAYYLRGGGLYATAGGTTATDIWRVRPAVVRDMDSPVSRSEYGAWLQDARDMYISEVQAGVNMEFPALKTELYAESDIIDTQAQYDREYGTRNQAPAPVEGWGRRVGDLEKWSRGKK